MRPEDAHTQGFACEALKAEVAKTRAKTGTWDSFPHNCSSRRGSGPQGSVGLWRHKLLQLRRSPCWGGEGNAPPLTLPDHQSRPSDP